MARDATNMPFERSTSYQINDSTEQANDSDRMYDSSLKIENMLLEEFNYAGVTAYQAMEDRARISSFYYLLVGVLASGLAAIYQLNGGTHKVPPFLVATLLIIGALISVCFFVTLIRLRQAHKESLLSMNQIKEFYICQFKQQMPAVEHAFRWRQATLPKGERMGSVTFMIAALNACIGSLCLAGAVFILTEQPLSDPEAITLALIVFLIAVSVHIYYYRKWLSEKKSTMAKGDHKEDAQNSLAVSK